MKVLIIFSALFVGAVLSAPPAKDCSTDRADECTKGMMKMYDDKVPLPATVDEMAQICSEIKNSSKCFRRYMRDCASSSVNQMVKQILAGSKKAYSKHCSPTGIPETLLHRPCLEQARGPVKQCVKQVVRDMLTTKNAEKKQWHGLSCCYSSRAYQCITNAFTMNCNKESGTYFKADASGFVSEMMETFCSAEHVWGASSCSKMTMNLQEAEEPSDSRSVFPVLIEIVSEISDNMEEEE